MSKLSSYRLRNAIEISGINSLKNIRDLTSKYFEGNKYMPDSNSWCDSFIKDNKFIYENYFRLPQYQDIKCNFAFNKNLSRLTFKDLPGNMVFIFEADGDWNLSGGNELLTEKRAKDQYFMLKKQRFIYILFIDGTIVKYRLLDGAIAKYEAGTDKFTNFIPQNKSIYSPLKWTMK